MVELGDIQIEEGAGIMEAWLTALLICELGKVSEGRRVLIYAAASGVGTAAIQLVRLLKAEPIALCSGPEKVKLC
jgi:tumor protein p53-inducible protein 3